MTAPGPSSGTARQRTLGKAVIENSKAAVKAWQAWPKLSLRCDEGIEWTLTDIPFSLFNVVLNTAGAQVLEEGVGAVLSMARERGVSTSWLVSPWSAPKLGQHLERHKLQKMGTVLAMWRELHSLPDEQPLESLRILPVDREDLLRTWCQLMVLVYGFPADVAVPWLELHAAMGLGPERPWRHYVAYWNTEAVGTASVYLERQRAVIANVGTVPGLRGRGVGRKLTLRCLEEAAMGTATIATLSSSRLGEGVYRRLGFQPLLRLPVYFSPLPGSRP